MHACRESGRYCLYNNVETLPYIGRLDPALDQVGISLTSGFHFDSSHSLSDFNLQCARIEYYYSYFMKCSLTYCNLDVVLVVKFFD